MEMLSSESDATYSFQGMKRKLGLHQEKLTRILRRLEDDNLVLKTEEGYRILGHPRRTARHAAYGEPIIHGLLPPGTNPEALMSRLKGRWFKNFRWLAYASGETGVSLYWITEEGRFQIKVQLSDGEVSLWSQPTDPKDTGSPMAAGYELFDRISATIPEAGQYS